MRSTITKTLGLMLALGFVACSPQSFQLPQKNQGQSDKIALEPSTQASDRPTESGTGVPGYLVDCSVSNAQDTQLEVSCRTLDQNGTKVPASSTDWESYAAEPAQTLPTTVRIDKLLSPNPAAFDVLFIWRGESKDQLLSLAKSSRYRRTMKDAEGREFVIQSPAVQASIPVVTKPEAQCLGGTLINAICFRPVDMSCTNYCEQSALSPHPLLITQYGVATNADEDANKLNCQNLMQAILGKTDIRFRDTHSGRGLACFLEAEGTAVYDKTTTDLSAFPRLGDLRVCACQ